MHYDRAILGTVPAIIAALLLCSAGADMLAQGAIGVYGGLNSSSISGDVPSDLRYSSRIGFQGGLIGEIFLAEDVALSLQPAFVLKGTSIGKKVRIDRETTYQDTLRARLSYISLPVLLKVSAFNGRSFVNSGLELGVLLASAMTTVDNSVPERDLSSALTELDLAAHLGFGVVFPLGGTLMTVEARYAQSLLNLSALAVETGSGDLPVRFRSSSLQLHLAFLLPVGGSE